MFNKVFNVNNPFWQSMGTIFDLFWLNLLWLVCCIPVITIGPSTTAMFYTLIQRARGEQGYMSHDFFRSFKQNLKQGMILGILLTLIGCFLAVDVVMCRNAGHGIYAFFMVFFAILFIIWSFITLYTFPLLSKFDRKNGQLLAWAFILSIKNIPMTLLMLVLIVIGIAITYVIPGLIFIMGGLLAQFCATIFASIFKPYLPKPDWMEDGNETVPTPAHMNSYMNGQDKDNTGTPADNTYADFDEAAFYGYDLSDLEKLDGADTEK